MAIGCPRCHEIEDIHHIKRKNTLECQKCDYVFTDDEVNEAYGLRRVVDELPDGEERISYVGTGDKYKMYPCWYCMQFFKSYDDKEKHIEGNHNKGDPMKGCLSKLD